MRYVRYLSKVSALLMIAMTLSANADGVERSLEGPRGIYVSKLCISEGSRNGNADVELVFENYSGDTIFLDGLSSDVSEGGQLYFKNTVGSTVTENGFGVGREEVLDLSTSHLGVRLTGLKQDLVRGDHPTIYLRFRSGTLETTAHVVGEGQC